MAVRHYRVSPLRPKAAQEDRHVLRRDRWRRRAGAGGLDVVLVVAAGHRTVPAPPRAAARRMALLLAGGRPAGPLTTAEPRMGTEQGVTEGATLTPGPGSGHRVTSRLGPGYPMSTPCSGWIRGGGVGSVQAGLSPRGSPRPALTGDDDCRTGEMWLRRRCCDQMAWSVGFLRFVSSPEAPPATGVLTLPPVGLSPTEQTSLR